MPSVLLDDFIGSFEKGRDSLAFSGLTLVADFYSLDSGGGITNFILISQVILNEILNSRHRYFSIYIPVRKNKICGSRSHFPFCLLKVEFRVFIGVAIHSEG